MSQNCSAPVSPKDVLRLHIPRPEDGWFYIKMMTDPATMAYNAPWSPPYGCIPDAENEWKKLCEKWIGRMPERFYAFIQRASDGKFVGDVNYHRSADGTSCDIGVVIYAPERGKGYGKEGLRLLVDRAFRADGIARLNNEFEAAREAAYRAHTALGFREIGRDGDLLRLELTRDEYLAKLSAERKPTDVSFVCGREKFNYRVCALIVSDGKILAMHDERSPYYYLPGGRVHIGETAEDAVIREVREELNVTPRIIRPLWLDQNFFTEDCDRLDYHELCIYFLTDVSGTGLLEKGERFTLHEGGHTHDFEWLPFGRLKDEYFYPLFLKKEIFDLPDSFTVRTDRE